VRFPCRVSSLAALGLLAPLDDSGGWLPPEARRARVAERVEVVLHLRASVCVRARECVCERETERECVCVIEALNPEPGTCTARKRELSIDNLISFIIAMIRWTGLAPWKFELGHVWQSVSR